MRDGAGILEQVHGIAREGDGDRLADADRRAGRADALPVGIHPDAEKPRRVTNGRVYAAAARRYQVPWI